MATQTDFTNAVDYSLDLDDWAAHIGAATQALAKFFNHAVSGGSVPTDILQGLILGLSGQTTDRNAWRILANSDGSLLFQRNTGSEGTPSWTTRFTIPTGGGIAYANLVLTNSIVNADVNTAAAIAYSKLNLAGGIVNADVS